jgi:hypothetical protein
MMNKRSTSQYTDKQSVYIAESSQGYHKIGISKHPEKRAEQLSIPGVLDMHIIHTIPSMFARRSERILHETLLEYKVSPEWFKLPDELLNTLCEFQGEHDLLTFCGAFAR